MSGLWLFLLVLVYSLTCIVVIASILLQAGKGGGLSSLGSGAGGALSDSLGATGAEKTLVKATTWASGIFLALSLILTLYGARLEKTGGLSIGTPAAQTQPAAPASAPATQPESAPAASDAPVSTPADAEKSEAVVPPAPAPDETAADKPAEPASDTQ